MYRRNQRADLHLDDFLRARGVDGAAQNLSLCGVAQAGPLLQHRLRKVSRQAVVEHEARDGVGVDGWKEVCRLGCAEVG